MRIYIYDETGFSLSKETKKYVKDIIGREAQGKVVHEGSGLLMVLPIPIDLDDLEELEAYIRISLQEPVRIIPTVGRHG
jgi:hypothetical protein